jgi:heme exporter protein A
VFRGERCLFQNLGFELDSGELLLLEGPNGSGKTSLLRVIAGLLSAEIGEVLWNDEAISRQRQAYHGSLVWMTHRTGLKGDLTLIENLQFEQALRPQARIDIDAVCDQVGIAHLKRLALRLLSAGQQRRVVLARMLLADVPLWLMDEPFTNLDRAGRDLVLQQVQTHLEKGGLCVMAAHQDIDIGAPVQRISL